MLGAIMQGVLRWFTQGLGRRGRARTAQDNDTAFEHVDSARLGASDFHASASMRVDTPAATDFAQTLLTHAPSLPRPRARSAMTVRA